MRTVADLDDDRVVYRSRCTDGGFGRRAHLSRGCPHVSDGHRAREAGELWRDVRVCLECSGEHAEHTGGDTAIHDALLEADPEDLGLEGPP